MNPDRELFIRYLRLAASALAGARNMARESFPHLEADLSDMEADCLGCIGDVKGTRVIDIVDGRVVALDWVEQ